MKAPRQQQPAPSPASTPVAVATTTTPAAAAASLPHQHQHQQHQQLQQQHKPAATRKERRHLASAGPSHSKDTGAQQLAAGSHEARASPQQLAAAPGQALASMAYQQKHALHRLKRLKKRAPHRDLVISFVPRLRTSIINRLDFFHRYSKQEQEVLSCFDFLDELIVNFCDGESSPRYSHKLYQSMIYQLI